MSSSAVFPEIDKNRIARELRLEDKATKRGSANVPSTGSKTLDQFELDAISRVERLRRRGLENFETNRRIYVERLNLAVSARMQVEIEANDAHARFSEVVTKRKAMMVNPRERVQETYRWRTDFRKANKLQRPAKKASGWPNIIGLSLLMIILESVGNAYLFSQKNPLGILGGTLAAFLVSFGNVSVSTLVGMASRYANCRGFSNLLKKFLGVLCVVVWIGLAAGYNLAIAHFRDAVETVGDWRTAGYASIETLLAQPGALDTLESYILLILGAFISILAFLKGHNSFDRYPAYSRISQDVIDSRNVYIEHLEGSIGALAVHRDDAVEALREANDEVHRNITDSVDALYGQKALNAGVAPFLEQCDIAAQYLLAVYRDANKAARTDDPPLYFEEKFSFAPFVTAEVDESRKIEAEQQVREVAEKVNEAIKGIFQVFQEAVDSHYEIDELEGTVIERRRTVRPLADRNAPEANVGANE